MSTLCVRVGVGEWLVPDGSRESPLQGTWVAVRGIVKHAIKGHTVYEERITLWRTTSMDRALELAGAESTEYAAEVDAVDCGLFQAYLSPDEPGHGAEMFSLMRTSRLEADEYLSRFFDTGDERTH